MTIFPEFFEPSHPFLHGLLRSLRRPSRLATPIKKYIFAHDFFSLFNLAFTLWTYGEQYIGHHFQELLLRARALVARGRVVRMRSCCNGNGNDNERVRRAFACHKGGTVRATV